MLTILLLLLAAAPSSPPASGPASARRPAGHVHEDVPERVDAGARWVFYVHGKILELQGREATSPDFGRYQYDAILEALASRGFEVVSEVRPADASDAWVGRLVGQVRRLREKGVPAARIAVIGASRGGFLTVQAAAELADPGLSYVVLAGCGDATRQRGAELRGRILSIFDRKDRFSPSCQPTFDAAPALTAAAELTLDLGLDHGLLYRPLPAWLDPAERWIRGDSAPPR